jgi:formate dehydrogenase (coenzyme F420) beta subunit
MTEFAVYKNKPSKNGAGKFLQMLLSKNMIDGLLCPAVTQWSLLPMPHLFTSVNNTETLAPLAPVAPLSAATQATRVLKQTSERKIAVVLKPCEIRALIELAKLNQCIIDENVIIIGIECRGRLENQAYLTRVKEDVDFPVSFYKNNRFHDDIAIACQGCTDFMPEQADISIATLDWNDDETLLAVNSEKGKRLISKANLKSSDPTAAKKKEIDDLKDKREKTKKDQLKSINEDIGSIAGFQKVIAECINCQNCRTACPVCYCRQCVFKTDVFDASPDVLHKRAEKKIGIKLPQDTTMFHMTRMLHIAHACVGCGQCTSACPQLIPVADFFRAAAEKMQKLYEYKPGNDIEEKIPMLSFGGADGE